MKLTRETIERRRAERKVLRNKNRRRTIRKACCKECGQPKHYVCLEHHQFPNKGFKRFHKKVRQFARKMKFILAKSLNLLNDKQNEQRKIQSSKRSQEENQN
jgi:hypothetical protein